MLSEHEHVKKEKYLEEMMATSCFPGKVYKHVWLEGENKTIIGNLISH